MTRLCLFFVLSMAVSVVWAQADDLASERAKIANQRIEAEARKREEEERLAAERSAAESREEQPPVVQPMPAAQPPAAVARPPAPAVRPRGNKVRASAEMDRLLEQIRTLGELRDAGYVTEREFERIKARILDGSL